MRIKGAVLATLVLASLAVAEKDMTLWYDAPAQRGLRPCRWATVGWAA